jgi:hypothetical protein
MGSRQTPSLGSVGLLAKPLEYRVYAYAGMRRCGDIIFGSDPGPGK